MARRNQISPPQKCHYHSTPCSKILQNFISLLFASPTPMWKISLSTQSLYEPSTPLTIKASLPQTVGGAAPNLVSLGTVSLALKHKLNKTCLEISRRFPLDFYLGEPENPNASNSGSSS